MRIFIILVLCAWSGCSPTSTPHPAPTEDVANDPSIDGVFDTNTDVDLETEQDAERDAIHDVRARASIAQNLVSVQATITNLDAQQTIESTNALSFFTASYHGTGAVLENIHVDVQLTAESLNLSRRVAPMVEDEFISLHGDVVSFDENFVTVRCEPFTTLNAVAFAPFSAMDNSRRFLLFYYAMKTGTNNKDASVFSASFDDVRTGVQLERFHPAGGASGRICVASSKNEAFTVQHVQGAIGIGETSVSLPIQPIDVGKSVVLVSHQATKPQSRPGHSQVACKLFDDNVRCDRGLSEDSIPLLRVQVVSFAGDTSVSHLTVTIPDGEPEVRIDDIESGTIIFGPTGIIGEVSTTADEKNGVPGSYVESWFEDSTLILRRGAPYVGEISVFPQIVNW